MYLSCASRHPLDRLAISAHSADETGGVTNYRGPAVPKGVRGSTAWHMFLCFSVVSLLVDCTNQPFQTNPKSLWNWQSVWFTVRIFTPFIFVGRGVFFTRARTRSRWPCLCTRLIAGLWHVNLINVVDVLIYVKVPSILTAGVATNGNTSFYGRRILVGWISGVWTASWVLGLWYLSGRERNVRA